MPGDEFAVDADDGTAFRRECLQFGLEHVVDDGGERVDPGSAERLRLARGRGGRPERLADDSLAGSVLVGERACRQAVLSSVSADERKQFCLRPFALGLVRYAGSGAGGRFLVGECVLQGYDGTSGQDGKPVEPEAADGVLEVTAQVQRAADAERLTVAIAVVITERDVLLVCRRDAEPGGITWQFPAGIVKPGASGAMIAVRETLSETDIHCSVRQNLGSRIHPVSGVTCEYYLCDYLIGEVQNRDPAENVSVT